MIQLQNDEQRNKILRLSSNMLIMGGPGSGKTTIALFKAKQLIEESGTIKRGQKVLFLSFARATISRVEEQAGDLIAQKTKQQIEINTYHGFIWNIIKHHGYLISNKPIRLLPPHEASRLLSDVQAKDRKAKLLELFQQEGLVHFDLFAGLCSKLLTESSALKSVICNMYPVIILDEFQDTNTQFIANTANETIFSGNIIDDWKQVVKIISTSQSDYYQRIIEDVKYLRLLQRGSQLYSALDSIWRQNNTYVGSLRAVSDALTHEHFSLSTRKWNGINIMTIHKSKGKEFDVVVVYDGRHQNKIMSSPERKEQAILNLRVAVTRAKQHTYIFTPEDDPCPLI